MQTEQAGLQLTLLGQSGSPLMAGTGPSTIWGSQRHNLLQLPLLQPALGSVSQPVKWAHNVLLKAPVIVDADWIRVPDPVTAMF